MKKLFAILVLFLFVALSNFSRAEVVVSPAELWITMNDNYINGSTSQKITVTNLFSYNVSVTAWMEHPDPSNDMRASRTVIENLSWITITPSKQIIPVNGSADFYINLTVPKDRQNETFGQHWETWAALQINDASESDSAMINVGYLVRVYTDPPPSVEVESRNLLQEVLYYTLIGVLMALVGAIVFLLYKKKTRR
ncbi:MAG: hypothetical protein NTV74_07535 [Euryarchaeota archaeon]|nr:hypothetical protein [Euryarchaeota archaeon]